MNILLYITIALIPFYFFRFNILGIPTNIFEAFVLLTLIFYIIDFIRNRKEIKFSNIDWAVIVFIFFALVSVSVSPDKGVALGIFKGWLFVPAILYFVIRRSFDIKNVHKLAVPLFVSLMIVSAWSIMQKFGAISTLFYQAGDSNFDQYLSGNVRLFGPFESPNFLAMFLVPVFFLSLMLFDKIKNIVLKIVFLILMLAPIYVLYYTKSRGGLLALAAAFLMLTISYILNRFKIYRSANLKGIIALIASIFVFFVYKIGLTAINDNERTEIYKYSWEMIKSNYLSGIGLGNFQNKISVLSANNISFRENVLTYALHPHNLYLAMWLYLGIGGFITFLVMIWLFLVRTFGSLDKKIIIYPMAAMAAILAHGLVDTTYFKNDLSAIFFLTLAIAVILSESRTAQK